MGLIVGTGLGSGIYCGNKLYAGTNCGAGEFGMVGYKDHNYEYYCSGQFFKNEHKISGDELFKMADENNEQALSIFYEFGLNLGQALLTIIYTLDPEIIILGGSVSKSFNYFKDAVYEVLNKSPYKGQIEKLTLTVSKLDNVAILGAAALYYEYSGSETALEKLNT